MNNLLQFRHPQWGSIIGHEVDIRLAVLNDELKSWEYKWPLHYHAGIYQLRERIEELEKDVILDKSKSSTNNGEQN